MKTLVKIWAVGALTLAVSVACNGDGSSEVNSTNEEPIVSEASTDTVYVDLESQTRTPSSAYISFDGNNGTLQTNSTSINNNSCFSLVQVANGNTYTTTSKSQAYYSTATVSFTVKNTCSIAAMMSNLPVTVSGLAINGNPVGINYIGQSSSGGVPFLTVAYTVAAKDVNMSISSPACSGDYCSWAMIPAQGSKTFTINAYVNTSINSFNVAGVTISGRTPTPPPSPGILAVNVDTTSLKSTICPEVSSCKIGVNVLDPTGAILKKILVSPAESANYTVTYQNLLVGNYTIAVDTSTYPSGSSSSISYAYTPTNGTVAVNSNATSNVRAVLTYTAPQQLGNLSISTGSVAESSTFAGIGFLSGIATNTVTKVAYPFSLGVNGSYTLKNVPVGTYSVAMQGMGDALTGVYYTTSSASASVVNGATSRVNLNFNKVYTAQNNVDFVVSGAPAGQLVVFADNTQAIKYNVNSLQSGTYKFLSSESSIAVTIVKPSGYTLVYTPLVITPLVRSFTATYTQNAASTKYYVGYYGIWSDRGTFDASTTQLANLDARINVIDVSFANPGGSYDPNASSLNSTGLGWASPNSVLKSAIQLAHNKGQKVILAVGGATYQNWGNYNYTWVANLVRDYDFDGVDIDYEKNWYLSNCSASTNSCATDQEIITIITNMRAALDAVTPGKLLSAAVWSVGAEPFGARYGSSGSWINPLKAVGNKLDFINVMNYDVDAVRKNPYTYDTITQAAYYRQYYAGIITIGLETGLTMSSSNSPSVYVEQTDAYVNSLVDYANNNVGFGIMQWTVNGSDDPVGIRTTASYLCNLVTKSTCQNYNIGQ